VRLRYDMSPQHIEYVLGEIRKVLAAHPKVESRTARARLIRFADYAFEVEIFAYILERENEAFLAEQENLILQIMNTLDEAGAGIALPAISSVVTQDAWVNPQEKKKGAAPDAGEGKT
jgi:MscS family membrane protein